MYNWKAEKFGAKKAVTADLKVLQTCKNIFKLRNRVRNYEKQLQWLEQKKIWAIVYLR